MNPNDMGQGAYGGMHTQYVPPGFAGPASQFDPHFGWPLVAPHYVNPAYMPHVANTANATSPTTTGLSDMDTWFQGLSVNLSNDIIGHFMAVMPAIMTLFGILVGTTVIVVIYRFLTSKI